MDYEYELRKAGEVIATGRLTHEPPLSVGDRLTIGQNRGIVSAVLPAFGGRSPRVTVELSRTG